MARLALTYLRAQSLRRIPRVGQVPDSLLSLSSSPYASHGMFAIRRRWAAGSPELSISAAAARMIAFVPQPPRSTIALATCRWPRSRASRGGRLCICTWSIPEPSAGTLLSASCGDACDEQRGGDVSSGPSWLKWPLRAIGWVRDELRVVAGPAPSGRLERAAPASAPHGTDGQLVADATMRELAVHEVVLRPLTRPKAGGLVTAPSRSPGWLGRCCG